MDFGLIQALGNMYSGPSQAEKNNVEFARLQEMQSFVEKQRMQKEQAALKMQMYDASVEKFADNLLAPDRQKLFQRSKLLKQSVREMIKANGGNMKDFFANGGHEIMGNYKSSLVNSAEASQYLQNKQNMSFILKAMNEGKSHLISPVDKANFDSYMRDGSGKITYSGVMGEIKMPDASKYAYGESIPLQDILNENRTTILGNYAIYNRGTSLDPAETGKLPTEQELLAFTAAMYGTQKGSNSSERIARNQEKLSWNQELRSQQNQPYEVAGKILGNMQAAQNYDTGKIQQYGQELNNMKTELEIQNYQTALDNMANNNGAGGGSSNGNSGATGGTDPMKDIYGLGTGESTDEYSTFTDLGASLMDYNATPGNAWSAAERMIKGNDFFGSVVDGKWKGKPRVQYNYSGTNIFDGGLLGNGEYAPTAAYNLFKTNTEKDKFATYAAAGVGAKYEKGIFKGFAPKKGMKGVYNADGTSIEYGHSSLMDDSDFADYYNGDYKVVGTIMAATVHSPRNGKQIIMNNNGKLAKEGYNLQDKAKMSTFAVIEKGQNRFYVEVDPENADNRQALQKVFDVTKATNQINMTRGKQNYVKDVNDASKKEYVRVRSQIRQNPNFQSVANLISGDGTYGDVALLDSFYMTMRANVPNSNYDQIVNTQSNGFLTLINEANHSLPNETGGNLLGRLKTRTISPEQFFKILSKAGSSPQDKALIQEWYNRYKNLKYNQ